MGYSYDVQSGGDSYLSYFWLHKVRDSNFDAIVWVDDEGSDDMSEWVDNLQSKMVAIVTGYLTGLMMLVDYLASRYC